jgi:hypothetical protein
MKNIGQVGIEGTFILFVLQVGLFQNLFLVSFDLFKTNYRCDGAVD